jgi:hypothetical protein
MTQAVHPGLAEETAAFVRRARAGDENAAAMLYRIGEEARKGTNQRALTAFAAIKTYIDRNPAKPFQLGTEPPIVANTPATKAPLATVPRKQIDPEMRKAPLPRGIFEKLFDPEAFAVVVVRACQFRNGIAAAAVVLASGPPLTNQAIHELGLSQFASDESSAMFFHGVKFSGESAWCEVAPHLDPALRRCLAIGQCVGRARRLQAVRTNGSRIGSYSEVAGWELGE